MSEAKQILDRIIENFDVAEFSRFFGEKNRHNALELSETERKDVYSAVCRLVWNRISKARSV